MPQRHAIDLNVRCPKDEIDSDDDLNGSGLPLMRRSSGTSAASRSTGGQVTGRPDTPSQEQEDSNEPQIIKSNTHNAQAQSPQKLATDTANSVNEDTKNDINERGDLWGAIWVHPLTLLCFASVYVCMTAGLIALWRVSDSEDGIKTSLSDNPYYWKYGPTAVLVVVTGLWAQVEKHCKLLTPWAVVSLAPNLNTRAVLLDYLSPISPVVLLGAARNKHWAVFWSTLGSFLLKMIITASTALIVLTPTRVLNDNFRTNTTTVMDITAFLGGLNYSDVGFGSDSNAYSAMLYYGALETRLPLRLGSSLGAAYQQVIVPEIELRNYVLTQTVDAFYPIFHCRMPELKIIEPLSDGGNFTIEMDVPPCPLADLSSGNKSLTQTQLTVMTMGNFTLGLTNYTHTDFYSFPCSDYLGHSANYLEPGIRSQYGATSFFIISEVNWELSYKQTPSGSNYTGKLERVAAVACNVDFRFQKAEITNTLEIKSSRSPYQMSAVENPPNLPAHGLNTSILEEVVFEYMYAAAQMPVLEPHVSNEFDFLGPVYYPDMYSSTGETDMTGLFQLIAKTAGRTSVSDCFNTTVLKEGAEASVNGVLAQWARDKLFRSTNATNDATLSYIEDRLQVRPVSLWLMFGGFLLMASICSILIYSRPRPTIPISPASVTGTATILAWNSRLHRVAEASLRFEGHPQKEQSRTWYRPLASHSAFAGVVVGAPLALITVLEILQHQSDAHQGFVEVMHSRTSIEGWTHYFPTVLLLILAMMFASLAFTISLLAQFSKLKSTAFSKDTIDKDLTMQMQFQALITALKTRQTGAALATFAALCASVLTIVVSGLYSVSNPTKELDVTFNVLDVIDPLLSDGSSGDNQASLMLSLVDNLGAGHPVGTLDTIVLPQLKQTFDSASINLTATFLTVQIPVYRAMLDCVAIPKDKINVTWLRTSNSDPSATIMITADLIIPTQCESDGSTVQNNSYADFAYQMGGDAELPDLAGSGTLYAGVVKEQMYHNYTPINAGPNVEDSPNSFSQAQIGCPTYNFMFAGINKTDTDVANATVLRTNTTSFALSNAGVEILQCSQKIQSIPANVRYLMPNFDIDLVHPPVLHENESHYLTNGAPGIDAFPYHFLTNLVQYYVPLHLPSNFPAYNEIDIFSQALLYGPNTTSARDLSGIAPGSKDADHGSKFYNATNLFYSRYMAQFINANLRAQVSSLTVEQAARVGLKYDTEKATATSPVLRGQLTTKNISRVIQHKGPKIALQVLLGLMAVSAGLAYWLVNMRQTLIREPCSIAGKSSLILGGRLLDLVPERGSGQFDAKRKRWRRSPFDGKVLRLAWWENGQQIQPGEGDEARYRIDVVEPGGKDQREQY